MATERDQYGEYRSFKLRAHSELKSSRVISETQTTTSPLVHALSLVNNKFHDQSQSRRLAQERIFFELVWI